MPVDTLTLEHQPVEAFGVLDDPRSLFLAYPGMQTRDALRWNLHVVPGEPSNVEYRFVQCPFSDNFSVNFDQHARFLRSGKNGYLLLLLWPTVVSRASRRVGGE